MIDGDDPIHVTHNASSSGRSMLRSRQQMKCLEVILFIISFWVHILN